MKTILIKHIGPNSNKKLYYFNTTLDLKVNDVIVDNRYEDPMLVNNILQDLYYHNPNNGKTIIELNIAYINNKPTDGKIKLSLDDAKDLYNSDNEKFKKLALQVFSKEDLEEITFDDIKNHYYNKYGCDNLLTTYKKYPSTKVGIMAKLEMIAIILNDGWTYNSCKDSMYYTIKYTSKKGYRIDGFFSYFSVVKFRTGEIAEQAIKLLNQDDKLLFC